MEIRDSYGYRDNINYGIIGNCQSSALIYKDSSIDWCCLPKFDSAFRSLAVRPSK